MANTTLTMTVDRTGEHHQNRNYIKRYPHDRVGISHTLFKT